MTVAALIAGVALTLSDDGPDDHANASPPATANSASTQPTRPTTGPTAKPTPTRPAMSPYPGNTGVPVGWSPKRTVNGDLTVRKSGQVVEDYLVKGSVIVAAANVTIRRTQVAGGQITNDVNGRCNNGLVIEDTSVTPPVGQDRSNGGTSGVIGPGGYTARRVKITNREEGFRVGGRNVGCGKVVIESSFARIVPPQPCGDWHGDGVQGYDGPALTVRNLTVDFVETGACGGTAAFFYPDGQGNTSVTIDGLLVKGGGYPFRLGTPGKVSNLMIVKDSWGYGPMEVSCGRVSAWSARLVTVDANYQPRTVRSQPCTR
ncbi:hypothetical protein GCM10009682_01830 [Luedemannella flava]|uniref:Right-handed parallel beta-helix repeat-containing protein n=2 Tax=Luedemannella flava TaxID=349316 RepID=A0ABP4XI44_9ACTN